MNRPSIYALFKDEEIVYIGQSINAYSRIGSHNKDKDFDYFRLMPCLKHRMNHWEEMLIQRYQPRYNKAGLKKSFKPMYRKSNTQKDTIQNNRAVDMREYGGGITFILAAVARASLLIQDKATTFLPKWFSLVMRINRNLYRSLRTYPVLTLT